MTRLYCTFFLIAAVSASAASPDTLWYRQPAASWNEALPIGNGRLGAMVFGGAPSERIQLNEDTVWAGEERDRNNPAGAAAIPEVRRLLIAGRVAEAEALADKAIIAIPRRMPQYQTLGDLNIRFSGQDAPAEYTRQLDLGRAVVRVGYRSGDATFTREIFSSAPDQAIVIRLTCDKPNRISFTATLARERDATTRAAGPDRVAMDGEAIARDAGHADERKVGVKFRAVLLAVAAGGQTRTEGADLTVSNANSVTLFLAAATNRRAQDPAAKCDADLKAASSKPYDRLLAAHVADYQKFFRRVAFALAGAAPDLPTDERLKRLQTGAPDPQFATLYFQFGRYLLISSSRPGGMAATLQGIWNDSLAPPWDSKYTININTEMNYWPAEVCNLPEMHEPLFDLVDAARPAGRSVAQALYGAHGFVIHHNTDIWGDAVPIDGVGSGIWPMGGAWLSLHFWDHYDFTRDRDFLAKRAYPVMKEAATFLLDYMVDDGHGNLVTGPSISPENSYRGPDGKAHRLAMGPYMDTEIARALLTRVIEASEILGVDSEFRTSIPSADRSRRWAVLPRWRPRPRRTPGPTAEPGGSARVRGPAPHLVVTKPVTVFAGWRVKWPRPKFQGWLKRETLGMSEPAFVVFKGSALPVLARARPQAPHQMGRALQIYIYENFFCHYSAPLLAGLRGFWRRESRMRSGRCSSSSSSPTASCRASATSASRSAIPRAKRTVA